MEKIADGYLRSREKYHEKERSAYEEIVRTCKDCLLYTSNSVLAAFSATAIAVFGLYIKIQSFVYMPANGVVQGMRPIMSLSLIHIYR